MLDTPKVLGVSSIHVDSGWGTCYVRYEKGGKTNYDSEAMGPTYACTHCTHLPPRAFAWDSGLHTPTHICIHMHACTHARTHARMHTCTLTHKHAHTHARMHARTYTRTRARTHARTNTHTHTHTHMQAHPSTTQGLRLGQQAALVLWAFHERQACRGAAELAEERLSLPQQQQHMDQQGSWEQEKQGKQQQHQEQQRLEQQLQQPGREQLKEDQLDGMPLGPPDTLSLDQQQLLGELCPPRLSHSHLCAAEDAHLKVLVGSTAIVPAQAWRPPFPLTAALVNLAALAMLLTLTGVSLAYLVLDLRARRMVAVGHPRANLWFAVLMAPFGW